VVSPILAAGRPPIITVAEPFAIASGGPTQTQLSPITAAGILPMSTLGIPGPTTGPPTCGMGTGNAGVCIGQVCMSVILAAGGIVYLLYLVLVSWLWPKLLLLADQSRLKVSGVKFLISVFWHLKPDT
jgi:hypothetical protein